MTTFDAEKSKTQKFRSKQRLYSKDATPFQINAKINIYRLYLSVVGADCASKPPYTSFVLDSVMFNK